jgi:hypothetical protein
MRRPLALAAVVLVSAAGCHYGDSSPHVASPESPFGTGPANRPRVCEAEAGSPTDVAGEPDWRRFGDYLEWTDEEGCLVRIDVLADRRGPEHCGFQDARVIITGSPLGEPYTTSTDDVTYVRDPEGVYGVAELTAGFDPDAMLPDNAVDSGYRQRDTELWTVPGDESAIYVVSGDTIERWPAGEDPPCA